MLKKSKSCKCKCSKKITKRTGFGELSLDIPNRIKSCVDQCYNRYS